MNNNISFPHIGEYYIPIRYVLKKITRTNIIVPELNNEKNVFLGLKYSPKDICMPFKYNMGNYLNALNNGANMLIHVGNNCHYGYFAELQAEILENLGYNFTLVDLTKNNHISIIKLYKFGKSMNSKLNIIIFIYYLLQGMIMIIFMDKLANYRRIHESQAINSEIFNIQSEKIKKYYSRDNLSIYKIVKAYLKYKKRYEEIPLNKERRPIKILLIGEPYSLMDSLASNNLENKLIEAGFMVYRYIDLTYLLIKKKIMQPKILLYAKKYLKYPLGANGTETVAYAAHHAKNGIDGIIHIKSSGCISELNTIPILNKISKDYKVPILYLNFDWENNNTNNNTKLKKFYDILKNKN